MFKKSLLALALAGVAASASAQIAVESAVQTISTQGLPATKITTLFSATDATDATKTLELTLVDADNSAFASGSKLVLELDGALFQNNTVTAAHYASTPNTATTAATAETTTFTVDTANSTSSRLVLTLGGGGDFDLTNSFDQIRLANMSVITSADAVSLKASLWSSTGAPIGSTTSAVTKIAELKDQWKAGVVQDVTATTAVSGALDAKIDVANARKTFVGTAATTYTDVLTFDIENLVDYANSTAAKPSSVTATLKGDFSGIKSIASTTATSTAAVTWTINSSKTEASATFTGTAVAADATTSAYEVTSNSTAASVVVYNGTDSAVAAIAERSFTLNVDTKYTAIEGTGSATILADAAAGSWALNSSSDNISYMPFGPNTAPIIQATSEFSEDALLSVSYLNPTTGKYVELSNIATVKANSVTVLGKTISEAVLTDFGGETLKTKLKLNVNAPTGKVVFFKAFKDTADKDRLGVN